jgi:hypothetical protein
MAPEVTIMSKTKNHLVYQFKITLVEWLKGHAKNYHPYRPDEFNLVECRNTIRYFTLLALSMWHHFLKPLMTRCIRHDETGLYRYMGLD